MKMDEKNVNLETMPKPPAEQPPEKALEVVLIDDDAEERERWKDKAGITLVPPKRLTSEPIIEEVDENGETHYRYGEATVEDFPAEIYYEGERRELKKEEYDEMLAAIRQVQAKEDGFRPLRPLEENTTLPRFPMENLPLPLLEYCKNLSESMEMSADLAGTAMLGTLAALLHGRYIISPEPGWEEPLCLFMLGVARPGEGKSHLMKAVTNPLFEHQTRLFKAYADKAITVEVRLDIARSAYEALRKECASLKGDQQEAKLIEMEDKLREIKALEKSAPPRLVANDVTSQKLAGLLQENKGRISIISAEGAVFSNIAGLYDSQPNFTNYLEAYSGDTIIVDRVGRPGEYINDPRLTMNLMVQPDVLDRVVKNKTLLERGLPARFLFSLPESRMGKRKIDGAPKLDMAVRKRYNDLLEELIAQAEEDTCEILTLSEDAAVLFKDFRKAADERSDGDLANLKEWTSKLPGQVLRLAGLMHVATYRSEAGEMPVDYFVMKDACGLAWGYYIDHARHAHQIMGADKNMEKARELLKALDQKNWTDFTAYEAARKLSSLGFKKGADAEVFLNILIDYGYLKIERDQSGKRVFYRYSVNPKWIAQSEDRPA
ncbi:YfjI family protein [Eubacterium sp. 1001713B170207_170306_E7]|uniref:YfjI family protein n=1 Tax=Eubacterium sp. 1001713B170207_170306_E7 TaxID=2787097 RepID=UPI001897031F|nr:YfjI family protein [Eubacterium sp. 1001713B170207_170306_E7]